MHSSGRLDFYSNFVDDGIITDSYYRHTEREFKWVPMGTG